MELSGPRWLKNPDNVARRLESWTGDDRFAPLRDHIATIERAGHRLPLFDPADAGVDARVLVVLEAPGPMADADKGSGFISVDNNDQTAANCWRAREEVGLVEGVLHWNIVPWYLGRATVKPRPVELADGAIRLRYLIDLLPSLQTVVLCGKYAREGYRRYVADLFDKHGPDTIETWHPSPQSLHGEKRAEFVDALGRAAARL